MKCPTCKADVDAALASDPRSTYPFCSDRCRLVDLGRWFEGAYQIEAERDEDAGGDVERDADVRTDRSAADQGFDRAPDDL